MAAEPPNPPTTIDGTPTHNAPSLWPKHAGVTFAKANGMTTYSGRTEMACYVVLPDFRK